MKQFMLNLVCEGFFIMLYWNMVIKMLKYKNKNWWRHTSLLYMLSGNGNYEIIIF